MRRALYGDARAAALALLAAPPEARPALMRQMLDEAERADAYRLDCGRAHPRWGTGSLMSAALTRPQAREPYLDTPDYAGCLVLALEALRDRAERD